MGTERLVLLWRASGPAVTSRGGDFARDPRQHHGQVKSQSQDILLGQNKELDDGEKLRLRQSSRTPPWQHERANECSLMN